MASDQPVRVLFVATYYVDQYVRQSVILTALRDLPSVEVVSMVVNQRGWWRYVVFLWKFFWQNKSDVDVIYLGWRTVEFVPLIRWITKKPFVLDAFVPIFETLCLERKVFSPTSLIGRLAHRWERLALRSSDHIVTDTTANAVYYATTFHIRRDRFLVIPAGVDRAIYHPETVKKEHTGTIVFFYGTYLPLHGVPVIIEAAQLLRDQGDIIFRLVGDGPTRRETEQRARELGLTNVQFIDRMTQGELAKEISQADICLGGPFSDSPKAQRVVTGKAYQFLAMRKPVIVSDTPGNREFLEGVDGCSMVAPNDPQSLAKTITQLSSVNYHELAPSMSAFTQRIEEQIRQQLQQLMCSYV